MSIALAPVWARAFFVCIANYAASPGIDNMSEKKEERYKQSELYQLRHSAAHVLAQAVIEMFPGETQIAIGPPIEDGFYYDFGLPRSLTPEDLRKLEKTFRGDGL